ncbi:hypothetical protein OMP38_32550 [Cohnella ginsengisoli]|uniref:Uncharacterized protein n=1 Tax=Cohnella ginsengisoli TaxID=425004 RepID=A0A9X4KRX9_9BACL|nr:hypothetical protein [Cohnella ginsengisoli]MDG0795032.1 hypothetical protein [Cohnella ginsengisoli]
MLHALETTFNNADYTVSLQPGENRFKITATNKYGKSTDIIYTVTYTPAP